MIHPTVIDTHCHLDMPPFDPDREEVWARARTAGVRAVIVPGVEPATWERTASLAIPFERYFALGIHPQALPDLSQRQIDDGLASLAQRSIDGGAIAIGECGFDGKIDLERAPWSLQARVFDAHVEIARQLSLPLIVHVLHAHRQALDSLRGHQIRGNSGVIHSYSGSADLVREYLRHGFFISFAGGVTRPNARRPVEAARMVPRDRLLLETDGPDQAPTGADPSGTNGRRCEPAQLAITVRRLAEIRNEDPQDLIEYTTQNAQKLFGLVLRSTDAMTFAPRQSNDR